MDALERFRSEFRGWVRAHNKVKGYDVSPDIVLKQLEDRLPEETLRQIGAAFINGWLENEPEWNRRYFVRESDRGGKRGGQWMLGHIGEGKVEANLELHIQLADYSRIRTVAERHGLTTRLEDGLMDITVYAGKELLLYVENKTEKEKAVRLLNRMRDYGKTGFNLEDPDKGNDYLRKSKYLVRNEAYPQYFAISAIGIQQVLRVEYLDNNNRFELHETTHSLTGPLYEAIPKGETRARSVVDPLALEIEYLVRDKVWVSPGSGSTAYNFYFPSITGDAIFLGVYEDGRIWSDIKGLGFKAANSLSEELSSIGITLDISKDWCFWKKDNRLLNLNDEDPLEIAAKTVSTFF